MYDTFSDFLQGKQKICVIQAENPDGDSLGSALALDYLLADKDVSLYCPVEIPKYLRYFKDWSRVSLDFDFQADGYIIVDTAASVLLSKLLDDSAIKNRLYTAPVFVLDHHESEDDLDFAHQGLIQTLPACCDLIYKIAIEQGLLSKTPLSSKENSAPAAPDENQNSQASAKSRSAQAPDKRQNYQKEQQIAEYLYYGIQSDTLGLTSPSVTADTFRVMADLVARGLNVATLDEYRRDFSKKSPRILDYKADLIKRVEYFLDGSLATVHIPWEDISEYSDEYNPNILILEELRMVEGVRIAVAIKTYPDGKITGKIRTNNSPVADQIAAYFGGGGHPYAAGFRTYDLSYDAAVRELITAVTSITKEATKN